jgi:uncharacterized damage-inducible protein DinB
MTVADVLTDAFDRIREEVHNAVDNLTKDELAFRLDGEANSIAWLVWHLTRVQDDHVAAVAGSEQLWHAEWFDRFGLPLERDDHGYGHRPEQVALVRGDAATLLGYYDAVAAVTLDYLAGLSDDDLDRVVDRGWDPPVTLGVRLVSVINDDVAHAGQAAFVRGVLGRR